MIVREHAPGIFRGSRPESAADVKELKRSGIRTILSLQSSFVEDDQIDDESFWAAKHGILFEHRSFGVILPPTRAALVFVLARMAEARELGPVFVHCHDGVDRTGAVFLAYDVLARGLSLEAASAVMLHSGFHLWRYWWWLPFIEHAVKAELAASRAPAPLPAAAGE